MMHDTAAANLRQLRFSTSKKETVLEQTHVFTDEDNENNRPDNTTQKNAWNQHPADGCYLDTNWKTEQLNKIPKNWENTKQTKT